MRKYEAIIIFIPNLEEEFRNSEIEKVKNIVIDRKGTIDKVDEWGQKRLAYEINKLRQGYYVLINFTSDADAVNEIDRICRIDENIMRHMIIRNED